MYTSKAPVETDMDKCNCSSEEKKVIANTLYDLY